MFSGGASFAAFCAPPGPLICALPWPRIVDGSAQNLGDGGRNAQGFAVRQCFFHGFRDLFGPGLIGLRGREHHHEEREQKRDEIGVGDQPTFMIFVSGFFFPPGHGGLPGGGGLAGARRLRTRPWLSSRALRMQERFELHANQLRIHALENAATPSSISSLAETSLWIRGLNLAGRGQEEEIGDGDAVDRGDKRDGDSAAHFFDIFQMFHHLNQAHAQRR